MYFSSLNGRTTHTRIGGASAENRQKIKEASNTHFHSCVENFQLRGSEKTGGGVNSFLCCSEVRLKPKIVEKLFPPAAIIVVGRKKTKNFLAQ